MNDKPKPPKGRESIEFIGGWRCPQCGCSVADRRTCDVCGYKRPSLIKRILGK